LAGSPGTGEYSIGSRIRNINIQDGGGRHLEKWLIGYKSKSVRATMLKICSYVALGQANIPWGQKPEILISKMAAAAILKNVLSAISQKVLELRCSNLVARGP